MRDVPDDGEDAQRVDNAGIEVAGTPRSAVFPPLCVRCGAPGVAAVRIIKVFRRPYLRGEQAYGIYSVDAPVCAACHELHRSEEKPPDPAVRRGRLWRWYRDALFPYALPLAALGVITTMVGPPLIPEVARNYGVPASLIWGGVAAFFAALMLVFFSIFVAHGMWRLIAVPPGAGGSWHARLERGPFGARLFLPVKPTAVVSAVDFSDNLGDILAGERHRFRFRNFEVGTRFAEANVGRVWNPRSPRSRISFAVWCILFAGLILLVLLAEFGDLVGIRLPFIQRR
jgi:hypothetical protein